MRVMILGMAGMLGHKLAQCYRERFDTWATTRGCPEQLACYDLFDPERLIGSVDAFSFDTVIKAFVTARPDVVINCIGIVKQIEAAKDPVISLSINSVFPHRLYQLCQATETRLIHISTDCVYAGHKGMYAEDELTDAEDLYGRSKSLGEVSGPGSLTIRTSLIGRELVTTHGLVEWFLSNAGGSVRGYSKAIFSGFPTIVLAEIIADIIEKHPDLCGIYHISAEPIDKCSLLHLLREAYNIPIEIEPYSDMAVDRSLDGSRFRQATGFISLPWTELVERMASDVTPYDEWRKK